WRRRRDWKTKGREAMTRARRLRFSRLTLQGGLTSKDRTPLTLETSFSGASGQITLAREARPFPPSSRREAIGEVEVKDFFNCDGVNRDCLAARALSANEGETVGGDNLM